MDTRTDSKTRLFLRILRFPLTRLLLLPYILFYVTFSGKLFMQTFAPDPLLSLVVGVLAVANLLLVYVSFGYFVERRRVSELTLPGMGRELGIGLLLGFGLFTACVLIAMALGLYRIEGIDSWRNLLPTGGALVTPVGEEMLFRGVVFRIFEEWFGGWIALVLSSVAFGLTHSGNEGETLAGIASIAFVFGPLLAAPFMVTRRLWMGIGLHGAWNYTMGKIFSGSVSGGETGQGFFKITFTGPELLTGGSAGMEGSLIAIFVSATASVLMLILAVRHRKIVPPCWKRRV
jgi:membrane protease YdiL (CAAX protease family)